MRILIACDGSDIAESAAAVVSSWGAEATGDVHLLSVLDPTDLHGVARSDHASPLFMGTPTAQGAVIASPGRATVAPEEPNLLGGDAAAQQAALDQAEDRTQAIDRARSEHFDYLRAVASTYFPGHEVEVNIAFSNDAGEAIAIEAGQINADLIAVGSHGRSGLSHILVGSVAEKLVRDGPVPVLVVGPAARERLSAAPAPGAAVP